MCVRVCVRIFVGLELWNKGEYKMTYIVLIFTDTPKKTSNYSNLLSSLSFCIVTTLQVKSYSMGNELQVLVVQFREEII